METCKVYKGLDIPCKIKGLLSKHFYIVFSCCLLDIAFLCMTLNTLILTWNFTQLIIELCVEIGLLLGVYRFFHQRSNIPKLKINKNEITISNRDLFKNLKNNKNG